MTKGANVEWLTRRCIVPCPAFCSLAVSPSSTVVYKHPHGRIDVGLCLDFAWKEKLILFAGLQLERDERLQSYDDL